MSQRFLRLLMLLVVVGLVAPIPATAVAQGDGEVYEDPDGRFSVPVPDGWSVQEEDGYGTILAPNEGMTIHALTRDTDDPEAAIAEAWEAVEPGFAMEPLAAQELPPDSGLDAVYVITYDDSSISGEIVQALAMVHVGVSYVLLIRADPVVAQERASQLNVIVTGFTIASLETIDLAGVDPRPFEGDLVGSFEDYVVESMEAFGIPGASIAIVQNGEVVYRGGFGTTELGGGEPVVPETRMMIGSTTKSFTTMMLATMVDDGTITWDTPVIDILPGFALADPALTRTITVEQLVCACAGVERRDLDLIFAYDDITAEDIVASLAGFDLFTALGEAFQYSNQMVATGGYAGAAAVHGPDADLYEAYLAEMQSRVLDPMGLANTTFDYDAVLAVGDHAEPHGRNLDGELVVQSVDLERFAIPIAPSGALWSNVDDMATYLLTELGEGTAPDGAEVVSAENLAYTWQPQVPVSADISYGLGWFSEAYNGLTINHHGGNMLGYTSDLAFVPEAGIGIVVLTNGQGTNLFNQALRYRMLELVYDLEPMYQQQVDAVLAGGQQETAPTGDPAAPVAGTPVEDPAATPGATPVAGPAGTPVPADAAAVDPWLGGWTNDALGDVTLSMDGDTLLFDAGEFRTELRTVPGEPLVFVMADPPLAGLPVTLTEGEDGALAVVVGAGVVEYTFVSSVGDPDATPVASPVASPAAPAGTPAG